MTVEASLSDQVGSQRVYVSYSSPSITINVENKPISSANVYFVDDKGKTERLTEITEGVYETSPNFKGVAKKTYSTLLKMKEVQNHCNFVLRTRKNDDNDPPKRN